MGTTVDTGHRMWVYDAVANKTTTYTYSQAERLTNAVANNGGPAYSYCYDDSGNRTKDNIAATIDCSNPDPFNSANQPTGGGATYDGAGNQTGPAPFTSGPYNGSDQTVQFAPSGQGSISAGYAGTDQSERTSYDNLTYANGQTGVQSQTDTVSTAGTTYFERDPSGTLIDMRVPNGTSTSDYYYVPDGNGSTVALLDSSGATVASYTYDPYGAHATVDGSNTAVANANPYRYDAGQYDTKTGLYHFGQRYYSPASGAWSQQDSIERLGDPSQGNRYAFVAGDPINGVDLNGMTVESDLIGAGVGLGVAVGFAVALPLLAPAGIAVGTVIGAGIVAAGISTVIGASVGALFE